MRRAAVFCLILGVASLARADAFQVIDTNETLVHVANGKDLRRIRTTVQIGGAPLNRFVVERVLPAYTNPMSLQPIILAPPFGFGNARYTTGLQPGGGDFENSIAANLASGGTDVFLYSTREALLAQHACDPPADCSAARGWGIQARLDDFVFIRNQIAAEHGSVKPVVGGESLGGETAVAAVNQDPDAYAGLIMIESSLAPWSDPTTRANYQTTCDSYHAKLPKQTFDTTLGPLAGVFWASQLYPDVLVDSTYGFPPGFTYRMAFLAAIGAASPGPPSSPYPPGFVFAVTDVLANKFVYSWEPLVTSLMASIDNYMPTAEFVDLTCAFAGDRKFTSNLKAFTGPVLAFEAELGLGIEVQSTLALLGSQKIQVIPKPGYGHADLPTRYDHATELEQPILDWMAQTLGN
jgi:pimeloyl-ACP methyl ester carboxylesterase